MAYTLAEAAVFTTNMVRRGVLETIIKNSVILQKLPFINVVGNAYQYLQEGTIPGVTFYDVGELWVEDTPTYTQKTAVIRIAGGDADVDNFLQSTRSDKTDLTASTITSRTKGIKQGILDKFYYGSNAANSKEFDGIHVLMPAAQVIHQGSGTTGAPLSLANLDAAIDLVLDGDPDLIISNRAMRRRVRQFIRANGGLYQAEFNEYGQQLMSYMGLPWAIDDFITQTEAIASGAYSAKTGGLSTTIFLLRFGSDQDLTGFQNGDLRVLEIGQLESKDAKRYRIKWYLSIGLLRDISIAAIDGVTNAGVVA